MLNEIQYEEIITNIHRLVIDQVNNGSQSSTLNNQDAAACGQFLNNRNNSQRGLLGASAAIRILSSNDGRDSSAAIAKILHYIENVEQYDTDVAEDWCNIIKVSEILFSLSGLKVGQGTKEALAKKCFDILNDNMLEEKTGWSLFIPSDEQNKTISLLATIFAAQAIYANSYSNFQKVKKYILEEIEKNTSEKSLDPSTYAICVMGIHVISNYCQGKSKDDEKKCASLYAYLWKSKLRTLDTDIEQNIEYWHAGKHYYIRIPWQLYLISLSTKYNALDFSRYLTQNRILSIHKQITQEGFKYPYSGPNISTRTNAIVLETINIIKANYKFKFLIRVIEKVDYVLSYIRNLIASRVVRSLILLISFALSGYIVWEFYKSDTTNISDIAPEIFGSILLWAYALGKRK